MTGPTIGDTFDFELTPEVDQDTQVVPAADVRVGDGLWCIVDENGNETQLSSGRRINNVQQVTRDGRIGFQFTYYDDWVTGAFEGQNVRISRRGIGPVIP